MQNHQSSEGKDSPIDLRNSSSPKKNSRAAKKLEATVHIYQALLPRFGFEFDRHYYGEELTDGIWDYFLGGILTQKGQPRGDSPAFGSDTMMHGVLQSILKSRQLSNRINVMPSLTLTHLAKRIQVLLSNSGGKKSGPQHDGKLQQLEALQLANPISDESCRLQGNFELDQNHIAIIKALLAAKIQDRQTSFLGTTSDGKLQHFICPEHILAASFIRDQSLQAMPPDLLVSLGGKQKKNLKTLSVRHQLHVLRYEMLDSVANMFPFSRPGDVIVNIVGSPHIQNHFFVVAIVKTTNGLAGAVFDSFTSDYGLRLRKEMECPKFEKDILGHLQLFLTINSHVLLPEYSIQEKKTIIEDFFLYTPIEYRQPTKSNVCWLYSIAIIEKLSQSSELISIGDVPSAHILFDSIAASVASTFSNYQAFRTWVQILKRDHWDSHLDPDKDNVHTWVGCMRSENYEELNKWSLKRGAYLEPMFQYPEAWVLLEVTAKSSGSRRLAKKRVAVGRMSLEENARAWANCLEGRFEFLQQIGTKAQTNVSSDASKPSNISKMIKSFAKVLTLKELKEKATFFLNDPPKMLNDGDYFAFLHGEQEWPQYNDGEGGADLIFSPSGSTGRHALDVPKQVIVFHAASKGSFHAGSARHCKTNVNTANSTNFLFSASPRNRFHDNYHGLVPLYAWPPDSQLPLSRKDVRRPTVGGQATGLGETVTVEVMGWKEADSSQVSKKSLLVQLNHGLKVDKAKRNNLDFTKILATLKKLKIQGCDKFMQETMAVNILEIPGKGDCFPQACTLSIMLSADEKHGASLYKALFPDALCFSPLHRYVFKDNLCGCARFWFARWCCQERDIRAILEQSLSKNVFAQDGEGNGLSRQMKIADFLNLIARNSDQAKFSHFFYTKLMHYFVDFLQQVLRIKITLLILTSDTDNTLFHREGQTTDFKSDYFLVLVREGGQVTSASHYRPMLLDYQLDKVWQSCGLLPYNRLPKFVVALLEKHGHPSVKHILHNVGDVLDPVPTHKLLFSPERLSKGLFLWRVALMDNIGSPTPEELGKSAICGPLYSLGLLGPYPMCEIPSMCMHMFRGDITIAHTQKCATVLKYMACMLKALLHTLDTYVTPDMQSFESIFDEISLELYPDRNTLRALLEKKRLQVLTCTTVPSLRAFAQKVETFADDQKLVDWFCSSCEMDPAKIARNFAGIPIHLFWALYSSLIDRPIVVLDDVLSTWDTKKQGFDDDMTGHRFVAIASHVWTVGEGLQCDIEWLRTKAREILPKHFMLLKDPQTGQFSRPVASDALSAIIRKTSCKLDEGEPCGCRGANGDWKLSTYAQDGSPDPSIILSSSCLCASGFMPVLTQRYLDSPCLDAGIFSCLPFDDLKMQVMHCKKTLATSVSWTDEAFQDLIFSIGYIGKVELLPCHQDVLPCQDEAFEANMKQLCAHFKKLAILTRRYLQDEVDEWLALGGDYSKVNLKSSSAIRGKLLEQWFMTAQVCFPEIMFSEILV